MTRDLGAEFRLWGEQFTPPIDLDDCDEFGHAPHTRGGVLMTDCLRCGTALDPRVLEALSQRQQFEAAL